MDVSQDVNIFKKYVICFNILNKIRREDMNKCTLFLVFICGVVFAGLVSFLRPSSIILNFTPIELGIGFGLLPAESEFKLMDDGYVTMAKIDSHSEKITTGDTRLKSNKKYVTDLEERSSEIEALNSLKVARELFASGKNVRAGRLLEHAHSLAPRHYEVLLTYGEYLEKHRADVVQADHMFLKALTVSPTSSRAIQNRQRTQPIVEKIDISLLSRIDSKRDQLSRIPSLSGALRRIKKEAYFHHIFHSAAIEGNTLTLSQIRMILETGLSVGGKSIVEHNEILGLDLALRYINTTLVHRVGRITLSDILEIHRRVLGHADPLEAGLLRTTQVFVSDHVPPHPTKLQILMEEFVSWLNSPGAQKLHPIKYAALAHYKLVFIHPFVDGNGRTARLLMNFLLMQAGFPPVIIRKQDRSQYYNHLQTANNGDTRPFIRFIAHCTEKTIDVYLWATNDRLPEIEQAIPSTNPVDSNEKLSSIPSRSSTVNDDLYERKISMDRPITNVREIGDKYATTRSDINNNVLVHTLLDDDAAEDIELENSGYYTKLDGMDSHLWLHGHEDKTHDISQVHKELDEVEIYDTMNDIRRLQTVMNKNVNAVIEDANIVSDNVRQDSSSNGNS